MAQQVDTDTSMDAVTLTQAVCLLSFDSRRSVNPCWDWHLTDICLNSTHIQGLMMIASSAAITERGPSPLFILEMVLARILVDANGVLPESRSEFIIQNLGNHWHYFCCIEMSGIKCCPVHHISWSDKGHWYCLGSMFLEDHDEVRLSYWIHPDDVTSTSFTVTTVMESTRFCYFVQCPYNNIHYIMITLALTSVMPRGNLFMQPPTKSI